MGSKGETRVDQAHRGYEIATDESGYASVNPLYMSYIKDHDGYFQGQSAYGYKSIESFVNAVLQIKQGKAKASDFDAKLPTIAQTAITTAILEAGRRSLDSGGVPVNLVYGADGNLIDFK